MTQKSTMHLLLSRGEGMGGGGHCTLNSMRMGGGGRGGAEKRGKRGNKA